jgi:hypothetical protein
VLLSFAQFEREVIGERIRLVVLGAALCMIIFGYLNFCRGKDATHHHPRRPHVRDRPKLATMTEGYYNMRR